MHKKYIFIDMDGTAAEYRVEATSEDYSKDGFYITLEKTPLADYVNDVLCKDPNFEVFVLSAYIKEQAVLEKDLWNDIYLPNIDKAHRIYLKTTEDKAQYIEEHFGIQLSKDTVLIDDYSKNVSSWAKQGGTAIKWLNGINGNGKTFSGTRIGSINELDKLIRGEMRKKKHRGR